MMKALFLSAVLSCSLLSNAKDIKESNRDVSMQSKEQNVKDMEASVDFSACGPGPSRNLTQSWLRLDDFSEINAEHYEHDFEDFKKQLLGYCGSASEDQLNELTQKAEEKLSLRKHRYLSLLISELNRVAHYRQRSDLEQKIIALGRELGKGPDSFLFRRELPRILDKGREAQEQRSRTCSNVDFRENYPTLRTPRDQGQTGWCFSHAAADMMSIYYQKNNPGSSHRFSAVGAAIDYYYNDPHVFQWHQSEGRTVSQKSSEVEGGVIEQLLSSFITDVGVCSEENVRGSSKIRQHVLAIEEIEDLRHTLFGSRDLTDEESFDFSEQIRGCSHQSDALSSVFPNMPWNSFIEILKRTEDQNYMTRLVNLNCRDRRDPSFPDMELFKSSTNFRHDRDSIDGALESGNPIYIAYHQSVISDGPTKTPNQYRVSGGSHASLIIGRRFNEETSSCEYIVKNSYGRSCRGVHSSMECDPQTGNFYLPEDYLEASLMKAYWFDD